MRVFTIFIAAFLFANASFAATDAPGCELKERAVIEAKVYGLKEDPAAAVAVVDQRLAQAKEIADKASSSDFIINQSEYNIRPKEVPRDSVKALAWEVQGSFSLEVNSAQVGKALMLELIKNDFDVRLSVSSRRDTACRLKK